MKKYINIAFVYGVFAMMSGVFYREFTKWNGYTGKTTLAFTHLHLFVLGSALFLLLALFSQITDLEQKKTFQYFLRMYNIALPFMIMMFFVRGIFQTLQIELSSGISAMVSGIAGLSHIMMAIAVVLLFTALQKSQCHLK